MPDATAKLEEREVEPEKAAKADKKGKKEKGLALRVAAGPDRRAA